MKRVFFAACLLSAIPVAGQQNRQDGYFSVGGGTNADGTTYYYASGSTNSDNWYFRNCPYPACKEQRFSGHWEGVGLGFNYFLSEDYGHGLYPESDEGFMELTHSKAGKSFEVNLNLVDIGIPLTSRRFGILTGIGFTFDNYSFARDITLSNTRPIQPVPLSNPRKSKLMVTYLTLPMLLEFHAPENLFISAGVTANFNIGSHTKVKDSDGTHKDHSSFSLNTVKYDMIFMIGSVNGLSFYFKYALTPLFKAERAPEIFPMSVGIKIL
ncbi:MAG: PorT family protein [Bacteroidales bacterium]|jgi:hypothetical protein|nr:PorT family protein [Bacteroidales bacterium]